SPTRDQSAAIPSHPYPRQNRFCPRCLPPKLSTDTNHWLLAAWAASALPAESRLSREWPRCWLRARAQSEKCSISHPASSLRRNRRPPNPSEFLSSWQEGGGDFHHPNPPPRGTVCGVWGP